MQVINKMRFV